MIITCEVYILNIEKHNIKAETDLKMDSFEHIVHSSELRFNGPVNNV